MPPGHREHAERRRLQRIESIISHNWPASSLTPELQTAFFNGTVFEVIRHASGTGCTAEQAQLATNTMCVKSGVEDLYCDEEMPDMPYVFNGERILYKEPEDKEQTDKEVPSKKRRAANVETTTATWTPKTRLVNCRHLRD